MAGLADLQTRQACLPGWPTGRDATAPAISASALRKERTRPARFGGSAKPSMASPCSHWCGGPTTASDRHPPPEKRAVADEERSSSGPASSARFRNPPALATGTPKVRDSKELWLPRAGAVPSVLADARPATAR